MMIHHTRKMKAENVFDEILGTRAITGASDVNMVLAKNVLESTLHIQGRDIEDKVYKLNLSKDNFTYSFDSEGDTIRISPERKTILDIFEKNQEKEMKVEDLPGIGASSAEKLKLGGFDNLMSIAVATPGEIVNTAGVTEATARKAIKAARDGMDMGFQSGIELMKKRESNLKY